MPIYEVETNAHVVIAWADDDAHAKTLCSQNYPQDEILRVARRPRDMWVISKKLLGLSTPSDPCSIARDCLALAAGDKLHAIRLYMRKTGVDLQAAQRVIETNMTMGW